MSQAPATLPDRHCSPPTATLVVPLRSGLRVGPRGFARLCRANPEIRLELTAKRELIVMAPASSDSGHRNLGLTAQLWNWTRAAGAGLGLGFDSSAGFTLPNGAIRSPDASWIAADRWRAIPAEARRGFARTYPDFAAELRSPSDSASDLHAKMLEYIDQGARLGWSLDPSSGKVGIYRPDREVEWLDRPATLSGEDVLPGFVLDLAGIMDA